MYASSYLKLLFINGINCFFLIVGSSKDDAVLYYSGTTIDLSCFGNRCIIPFLMKLFFIYGSKSSKTYEAFSGLISTNKGLKNTFKYFEA